jgi:hypothetical protein
MRSTFLSSCCTRCAGAGGGGGGEKSAQYLVAYLHRVLNVFQLLFSSLNLKYPTYEPEHRRGLLV